MTDLVISEVFGPTVQGEGPSSGRRASFVRLGRCNLDCRWCDTPYTWDWKGVTGQSYDPAALSRRPVGDVVAEVVAHDTPLVVVTGGEPLLQRSAVNDLACQLIDAGRRVEVETNGTMTPLSSAKVAYVVSPKLGHSGVDPLLADPAGGVRRFVLEEAVFKFVVQTVADLDEVAVALAGADVDNCRVWVMPEGRDVVTLARRTKEIADAVVARGWNLTGRLHVAAWGDIRGH